MNSLDVIYDTRERLHRIITNYLDSQGIEHKGASLDNLQEIGVDSLGMLDIIFEIEGEFSVQTGEIDNEVLEKITTFDGLVDLVDSLRA
jgi:acyl carrier protein